MIVIDELDKSTYEIEWIKAERELAILEYENFCYTDKKLNEDKQDENNL